MLNYNQLRHTCNFSSPACCGDTQPVHTRLCRALLCGLVPFQRSLFCPSVGPPASWRRSQTDTGTNWPRCQRPTEPHLDYRNKLVSVSRRGWARCLRERGRTQSDGGREISNQGSLMNMRNIQKQFTAVQHHATHTHTQGFCPLTRVVNWLDAWYLWRWLEDGEGGGSFV